MRGQTYTFHFIASPFPFPSVQLRIELPEKALAIGVVVKNGLARVASGGEVIKRPGEFETGRPGHNGKIVLDAGRTRQGKVYCVSLTPLCQY